MKSLLKKILRILARRTLDRYEPKVVAVTGSVGKTTSKEAIYKVLSARHKTRRNEENYNNEIGVPMTVLGLKPAGKLGWLKNIFFGIKRTTFLIGPDGRITHIFGKPDVEGHAGEIVEKLG